jgi:hypothetical protein
LADLYKEMVIQLKDIKDIDNLSILEKIKEDKSEEIMKKKKDGDINAKKILTVGRKILRLNEKVNFDEDFRTLTNVNHN